MSHNTKPAPTLSDDAMATPRRVVVPHAGKRSVHTDFSDPNDELLNGSSGSGSAPGSGGSPTTGAIGPGSPLGMD